MTCIILHNFTKLSCFKTINVCVQILTTAKVLLATTMERAQILSTISSAAALCSGKAKRVDQVRVCFLLIC